MYIPDHFRPTDEDVLALLRSPGAVDLVTIDGARAPRDDAADGLGRAGIAAGLGEHGALLGHVAIKNDQWREPALGESMAIVRGPDAYITPTWYAAKREHGRVVPTWNYVTDPRLRPAGHPRGRRPGWRRTSAAWSTRTRRRAQSRGAWTTRRAPTSTGQLRAIVGVELLIDRIEAKSKLSQNRSDADIEGIIAGLEADGERGRLGGDAPDPRGLTAALSRRAYGSVARSPSMTSRSSGSSTRSSAAWAFAFQTATSARSPAVSQARAIAS